jgi:hypothetical protein
MGHHDAVLRRPHTVGDRRTRLSTSAWRSRGCAVSGCLPTLYEDLDRHNHQPRRRVLGRSPRRQHRRRGHARPPPTPLSCSTSTATLTDSATTTAAQKSSAEQPPEPDSRYSEDRSQVGNFAEHNWGISLSAVNSGTWTASTTIATSLPLKGSLGPATECVLHGAFQTARTNCSADGAARVSNPPSCRVPLTAKGIPGPATTDRVSPFDSSKSGTRRVSLQPRISSWLLWLSLSSY